MKINILGTVYTVLRGNKDEYPLSIDYDGYCDFTNKTIVITNDTDDYEWGDLDAWYQRVLRHEIVHAFMFESGLDIDSEFARNETLIDWIAIQIPKMFKVMKEANGI